VSASGVRHVRESSPPLAYRQSTSAGDHCAFGESPYGPALSGDRARIAAASSRYARACIEGRPETRGTCVLHRSGARAVRRHSTRSRVRRVPVRCGIARSAAQPHARTSRPVDRPYCVYRREQRRATLHRSGTLPELHSVAKIKIAPRRIARIQYARQRGRDSFPRRIHRGPIADDATSARESAHTGCITRERLPISDSRRVGADCRLDDRRNQQLHVHQ